jgi:O-acetyl-ADP-ribose deacetylase (regulator of RNase III)
MQIRTGNIFTSEAQTLVNTVNCVGVMGAGIALEFRFRYPEMHQKYKLLCSSKRFDIGKLWLYKPGDDRKWVLNFPTKRDWKFPSKEEYLHRGLEKFMDTYEQKGISSIAFPVLGASKGGLPEDRAITIMQSYLNQCGIPVEVYKYDPKAVDDLYEKFKTAFKEQSDRALSNQVGLRIDFIRKIRDAMENPRINSISRLAAVKGIGLTSLEKSFSFLVTMGESGQPSVQKSLL